MPNRWTVVRTGVVMGEAPAGPALVRSGPAARRPSRGPFTPAAIQVSIVGLFALGALYTVHLARDFVIPVLFAVFLNYLLSPVIRRCRRLHIPGPVAAAVLLLGVTGALGAGVYALSGPASAWVVRAPEALREFQRRFRGVQAPVQQVETVTQSLEQAAGLGRPERTQVEVVDPPLAVRLFGGTKELIEVVVTTLLLSFLLLAPGDLFTERLVTLLRRQRAKEEALKVSRVIEREVSRYLRTVTAINLGVGVLTGAAMWGLGVPDPAMWGAVAAVANFLPYVGPLACAVVLALASATVFPSIGAMLAPPLAYYAIHFLESNIVTPMLLERYVSVNAVVSFVGLLLFWLLLGIPGAILAVPTLVIVRILCDASESLRPVGAFLGPLQAR
jgi:predicted PurR-regulated permease PerM